MNESSANDAVMNSTRRAMRLVCANLPHLSGLANRVRILVDDRVSVAAVTSSGKLLVNPQVFSDLKVADAAFVLAHELMHLALDTHQRGHGSDHETVNYAHDYIINDMLRDELQMDIPLGGLDWYGARHQSLEQVITWMQSAERESSETGCWRSQPAQMPGILSRALQDAGLVDSGSSLSTAVDRMRRILAKCDVIPAAVESDLYPHETPPSLSEREELRSAAAHAASLGTLRQLAIDPKQHGTGYGDDEAMISAVRGYYYTPWELALQRWMEAVAPGRRTYVRPSRRGADRLDVVLPGRYREGWTLHIVLDTSGSMSYDLPRILGAIASFCENVGVADVHILQTDAAVHVDEFVAIEELEDYRIVGFGGSDMSPAMDRLNRDPEVTAAVVLTDGFIDYPDEEPHYRVLWVLSEAGSFDPPYGEVIRLD